MKKLFLFLCLLMLGAGMSVWAQLVLVPKDRPMSLLEKIDMQQQEAAILAEMATENIAQEDYQMAGRNNAPAATMASLSFSWSNLSNATLKANGTYNAVYCYNWTGSYPYLRLYMIFPKASAITWNNKTCPAYGTYTIRNSANAYTMMNSAVTDNDGSRYYRSGIDLADGRTYRFTSGTVTVSEGADGPYIVINSTSNMNSSGNNVTGGDYITINVTVGSPAPASGEDGTIQVVPGANGEIKVGSGSWQSTTFTQDYTGGTYVTISAQGTGDYVFDQWLEDGNTNESRTITVDGNATYTATFKKLIIHHTFYWANLSEGGTDAEYGSGDGLYVYRLYFTDGGINYPSLDLQLIYDKPKLKDYGSITAPPEGVYYMLNSVYYDFEEFYALGGTENSSYMSRYWDANNSYKPFRTGTITISQGANGYPYIVVNTGQGNGTKQFFELTVGEPAAVLTNYNVSITAPENGTITVAYNDGSDQSFTSGSRDIEEGTVLTVTTTPAADYHFNAWTGNGAASVTVDADKTIGATFAENDYFLNATCGAGGASVTRSDNGNNLTVKRAGNTVTLTPVAETGYEFLAWGGADAAKMSGNVFTFPTNGTHNTTYNVQATFQAITYNLTYEGLNGATNSNPDTYTIETATFDLADPGARDGYTFTGWTCGEDAIEEIAIGSTGDKTLTANWTKATTLTLLDNEDNPTYYNNIKALGDITALTAEQRTYATVTYHRSVAYTTDGGNARWYTLCLPFDVDQANMTLVGLMNKVYEFRYASGSADVGDQVSLHFRAATSMTAGQGYLVKATETMPTDYAFQGVTLNTSADTENDINALKNDEDRIYKVKGDIGIVGVLRKGTLAADGKRIMGLASNKIWYPHGSGNPMYAYRAYFYNPNASDTAIPRVRIVVEGEDATELEVVDGNRINTIDSPVRKYMENGMLIIELNGVRYNGQGQRL